MRFMSSQGFTDLNPHTWLTQANVVIRKDDTQKVKRFYRDAELFAAGYPRQAFYIEDDDTKHYLEMVPYVHPVGAGSLTIGSLAWSGRTRVFTPNNEGRILQEDGALLGSSATALDAIEVAGMMFTDYFYHVDGNRGDIEHYRTVNIEEGDLLWLVRRGDVELDCEGAVNVGDVLVSPTATAGEVRAAVAIDTSSIVNFATSIRENIVGQPVQAGLAQAKATIGAAGLVGAWLDLPKRFDR